MQNSPSISSCCKRIIVLSSMLIVYSVSSVAQKSGFEAINPLDISPALSGNFGELRPNHFHAGLDLKTAGVENLEVHAVADGYVSRIKVSPYGYGKALYIDHPMGYTTVYGHLNGYGKEISEYLKKSQYEQESFSVDIYPGAGDLRVKKGDIVAYTGNTGGSGGPHLHFEVRETKSEVPRNPLLFGFPITDSKSPVIQAIGIAPMESNSEVYGKKSSQHFRVSGNRIAPSEPIKVSGPFGLEVMGYDEQDGSGNHNGIFSVMCMVDGVETARFVSDSIAFNQSRYLNALIDYPYYYNTHSRFMRLYRLPGNALENLNCKNSGIIDIPEGTHEVEIKALDASGNKSSVKFTVEVSEPNDIGQKNGESIIWNTTYLFESKEVKLFVPAGSIYSNEALKLEEKKSTSGLSTMLSFMQSDIPLQHPFSISLRCTNTSEGLMIAQTSASGNVIRTLATSRNGDWLEAESKSFGHFTVVQDNQAPRIVSLNLSSGNRLSKGQLQFRISDNLSGIHSFRVTANGNWVLAEYEPKKNLLFLDVEALPSSIEKQQLMVEVIDEAGNVATFEASYYKE